MSNVHGAPTGDRPNTSYYRTIDEDGWRAPEMNGRPEQMSEGDGWKDHPLGHIGPYAYPYRTCWYCGSIHPDDLQGFLQKQGKAPDFDYHKKPEPQEGESFDDAYKRYVREQYNYEGGIRVNEADWKYGWPHKFYVEGIPNPLAGQTTCSGGRFNSLDEAEHYLGPAPTSTHSKFYTVHLQDSADFDVLAAILEQHVSNIHWQMEDGKLKWSGHRSPGVY